MDAIRKEAKKRLEGFCRVCKICDGRMCAGEVPGMGGIGTGSSFKANVDALSEFRFNMQLIHDVFEPETRVTLLGREFDIPVLAAPIGGVSFNMGGKITEEEYIDAVLRGCIEKGTLGSVGDGVPDFIHQAGYLAIDSLNGGGIPFIKPWEISEIFAKVEKASRAGASIFGMDIDAAGLITLKLMGHAVTPKPPSKLKEIRSRIPGKFILKGIMTEKDAKLAVEIGADAIVVSNHGGRVFDHTPGVAEILPKVSAAVKGKIEILADGGVRTGGDVLKMIALGADAVMIGRPFSVAAVGGLKEGVVKYIEKVKSELITAMILTGTRNLSFVDGSILSSRSRR